MPSAAPLQPIPRTGARSLDTRLLEMFVLLAEHRHYGKAARAAGLAQPALSQSISQLERLTGCQLFERTTRSVELTGPGTVLLTAARRLLGELTALGNAAARFERARTGRLVVGLPVHFGTTLALSVVARLAATPRAETVFLPAAELDRAVQDGVVDLGLRFDAGPVDGLCTSAPVALEPRGAVLGPAHPLADRAVLTTADLAEHPAIALDPEVFGPETALWSVRQADGACVGGIEELVDALVLGDGVCLAPMSDTGRLPGGELVQIPVTDLEPVALTFVWSAREAPPVPEDVLVGTGVWGRRAPAAGPGRLTG
jgi:DNA-binding transcriptional LysR family regulator